MKHALAGLVVLYVSPLLIAWAVGMSICRAAHEAAVTP
jgi:hypothetical protein